jgi:hypothetical protein
METPATIMDWTVFRRPFRPRPSARPEAAPAAIDVDKLSANPTVAGDWTPGGDEPGSGVRCQLFQSHRVRGRRQ